METDVEMSPEDGSKKESYEQPRKSSQLFHILSTCYKQQNVYNLRRIPSYYIVSLICTQFFADDIDVVFQLGVIRLELFTYLIVSADDRGVVPVAQ